MQIKSKIMLGTFRFPAKVLIYLLSVLCMLVGCTIFQADPPATDCIQVVIAYMPLGVDGVNDPEDWVPAAMDSFNQAYQVGKDPLTGQPLASGQKPICVTGFEMASGKVKNLLVDAVQNPANRDPDKLPTIFQPAVNHWFSLANAESGKTLFTDTDEYEIARAWVVIAIWQSRLDAIRKKVGYDNIGWEELLQVLSSPNGWQDYGIDSGHCSVYYGHTDPFISSTGLSTLISEFYASALANNFTDRILNLAAVNRADIQQGVRDIEGMIRHYAKNTTVFKNYIAKGPDYIDFVALPENDLVAINLGKTDTGQPPPEKLVALYPKEGTFSHQHPFGIVQYDVADGGWTTAEQRDAARKFKDYVLTPEIQKIIMSRGFRPANTNVKLAYPMTADNGIDPAGPAVQLDAPLPDAMTAIQNSWTLVKKQADIVLLFDVSGSMSDGGKLDQAKKAALDFISAIYTQQTGDRVGLMTFSEHVQTVMPLTPLEGNLPALTTAINGLTPAGGTALYDAVKDTLLQMSSNPEPNRIRAVVLLSDGQDTDSHVSLNDIKQLIKSRQQGANQTCQQAPDPVVVFPIAYGLDPTNQAVLTALKAIANASGTEVTNGDTQTIQDVLKQIAGYLQ